MAALHHALKGMKPCLCRGGSITTLRFSVQTIRPLYFLQPFSTLQTRNVSTEAEQPVQPPIGNTLNLEYSEKVTNIANSIASLTLLEVASLNKLLKEKLNIQDVPMMPMGAMAVGAPAAAQEEAEEAAPEKTEFTVKLVKYDDKSKVKLIKEIKGIMADMNLVQAKKFVESSPQVLKENIPKDEAEKIKKAIEEVGGTVEID